MEDEKKPNEMKENNDNPMAEDYAKAIKELKETTVSKQDYEALRAENQKLLRSLVNGETQGDKKKEESPANLDTLRKAAFAENQSNLEQAQNILALREAIMKQGGEDPFLPIGCNIAPTREDRETAKNVADCFAHCIEYAEGDSELFTNELMRLTKDAMPMAGRKK